MQKQKGVSTLVGIIIIVAVAIVAFGGVFAYQYYSVKIPDSQNSNVETAGWKTYTNTQYRFDFKYPPDYLIYLGNSEPEGDYIYIRRKINEDISDTGGIFVGEYSYNSLDEMENSQREGEIDSSAATKLGGKFTYSYGLLAGLQTLEMEDDNILMINFIKGGKIYTLLAQKTNLPEGEFQVTKKIFSTFKFTK